MQTSDPRLLFQTSADIAEDARQRRLAASRRELGDPIHLKGKVLDILIDGQDVFVAASASILKIDLNSGEFNGNFRGHTGPVTSVALYVKDDSDTRPRILVSGSWDKTIKFWDVDSQRCLYTLSEHADFVKSLLISENTLFSTSSDKTVRCWDLSSIAQNGPPSCFQVLREHTRPVLCAAQYRDAESAPSLAHVLFGDSLGRLTEWTTKERSISRVQNQIAHDTSITCIRPTEDGLWSGSMDKTARFRPWKASGKSVSIPHPSYVKSILPFPLSIQGNLLLTGCEDGIIRLWDVSDVQEPVLKSAASGHAGEVSVLLWIGGMRWPWSVLSGGLDQTVRRWTVNDLLHPKETVDEVQADEMLTEEELRELEELMDE